MLVHVVCLSSRTLNVIISSITYRCGSGQSDTMEIKPNPVYGVSLQQTPQAPGEVEYYVNEGIGICI